MSAGELIQPSQLALPNHAWAGRHSRRSQSPDLAPIRGLVSAFLLLEGGPLLLGEMAFLWKGRWFEGIHPLYPFLGIPEPLSTVALGLVVLRGSSAHVRKWLGVLLISKGLASVSMLLNSGVFANSRWFAIASVLAWTILGLGVWRATTWGRRGCTITGLAMCGYHLTFGLAGMIHAWNELELSGHGPPEAASVLFMPVFALFAVAPLVLLAIYGVLPSTRRHFADVRAAAIRS